MKMVKGFYRKKDRHGNLVTHPITEKLAEIRKEPYMAVYDVDKKIIERNPPVDKKFMKEVLGYKVYWVDSDHVKDRYNLDFFFCGHGYAEAFIPKNELWIKAGRGEAMDEGGIFHEFTEAELMKEGKPYKTEGYGAHTLSNHLEKKLKEVGEWDNRLKIMRQIQNLSGSAKERKIREYLDAKGKKEVVELE